MTEITDNNDGDLHDIDSTSFWVALIAAPLIIAVLFCWVYLIPVFAVILGGLPWLLFGGPALWLTLKHKGTGPLLMLAALGANLLGTPVYAYFAVPLFHSYRGFPNLAEYLDFAGFLTGFGALFSLTWGMAFWLMYRGIARERETKRKAGPEDQTGQTSPQS